ncbi:MAG TPA: hypothetical protein VHS58_08665 [Acetobacteraceae bacterium]|nr:hypothetical protein [Acetobacteraceae bacterium]
MRFPLLASAALASVALAAPAIAQTAGLNPNTGARPGNVPGTHNSLPRGEQASNIEQSDTRSVVAPTLPVPQVANTSSPRDYVQAADRALARGHTGEAQEALERAETRLLDLRANPAPANGQDTAVNSPIIDQINQALQALGRHDVRGARQIVSNVLSANGGPMNASNDTNGAMNGASGMNGAVGSGTMNNGMPMQNGANSGMSGAGASGHAGPSL